MKPINWETTLAIALALTAQIDCGATMVILTPAADARLLSNSGNEGSSSFLSAYNQPGVAQRSVIQFDLAPIPSGNSINSAILTLRVQPILLSNPSGFPIEVYRVTQPWTEAGVTWDHSGLTPWTAGGDYAGKDGSREPNAVPYAANSTANPAANSVLTWDITGLAQEWYTGTYQNNGLLMLSDAGIISVLFYSSESSDPSYVPTLSIDYAPVPEPATWYASVLLLIPMGATLVRRLRNR